ncbi:MAG TPA: AAA family ATPase [Candidatus Limnocylindria bacterium]|nr:AAA family ATPase [Candidatus Limnocylindria bacterium]
MALLERDALLGQLGDLLAESRRGRGCLALLTGEAGIGKSALVTAFGAARGSEIDLLLGTCDSVLPARPFAPVRDMAAAGHGSLGVALGSGDRNRVFDAFLNLVRRPSRLARVVVIEDLHWADEATLDLLRVVGRRLPTLPVLVVGTYRDEEVGADHPLRLVLGDLPGHAISRLDVPPLSAAAVARLAENADVDAAALYRATGGNPFFVTEVISAGNSDLPATVRDAVLARSARLSAAARDVLNAASILGERAEPELVKAVAPATDTAIHECIERGMLLASAGQLAFRHDIARRAVVGALSPSDRAALHERALEALRRDVAASDPGRLAYHAVGAGAAEAVLEYVPAAGAWSAKLGAHREAVAHYEAALDFAEGLDDRARARLLQAHAREARITDQIDRAIESQTEALAHWRRLDDHVRAGDALRELSMLVWVSGDSDHALRLAESAVALLEAVDPPGRELARAYAALAQRFATTGRGDTIAVGWAGRALELAERLNYESVAVHALTTIGLCQTYDGDERGWGTLEEALRRARAAGVDEGIGRAQANLIEAGRDLRRYDVVDRYRDETLAFLDERHMDLYLRRVIGELAEVALERGQWQQAAADAERLLRQPSTAPLIRARALMLLGRLRARRGDAHAMPALDEALRICQNSGENQELCPLHAARAEAAWLAGDVERARAEAQAGLDGLPANPEPAPFWQGELAFWAWKGGSDMQMPEGAAEPYRLHWQGSYRQAAAAWQAHGCPYQEALALADGDESDLRRALEIFLELGARPMALRVRRRLRELGARAIKVGPRTRTRRNPAGLTDREIDVLALLARGLRNSEIADRLVLSAKTVDHHVSALFLKLGVHDRAAATVAASRLGLKDGGAGAER